MSLQLSVEEVVQLRAVLLDEQREELNRAEAAHKLGQAATPEAIDALVEGLEIDQAGVRWAVSEALAQLGLPALDPILRRLQLSQGSKPFYETVHQTLRHLPLPPDAVMAVKPVLESLHGQAISVSAPLAAASARRAIRESCP